MPDQPLDQLISNQRGPGWVGGDSTYSTALPDGREAFVFSDTLVGTAGSDGTASVWGFVHSSELVGTPPNLQLDCGGSLSSPTVLIPDTYTPGAEWETSATLMQGSNQLVFVNEYNGPPGILTLNYTGRAGIAVLTMGANGLPTPSSVVLLPADAQTEWGQAEVTASGYLYVYGAVLNPAGHNVYGMKIARVPVADALDVAAWRYWNGYRWMPGEPNATIVATVNQLTGVIQNPSGNGFIAVSIPSGLLADTTVDFSYSRTPQGPWTQPEPIYTIPEIRQYSGEFAYFPTFHPELGSNGQVVVSYDLDSTVGAPVLLQDIRSYQPRFLLVSG